ncbi:MAG: hypothetical protein WA935_15710, partial [Sphingopyxis granuli]
VSSPSPILTEHHAPPSMIVSRRHHRHSRNAGDRAQVSTPANNKNNFKGRARDVEKLIRETARSLDAAVKSGRSSAASSGSPTPFDRLGPSDPIDPLLPLDPPGGRR